MGALTTVTQSISCHISGCFGRLIDYEQHTSVERTRFAKDTRGSPWGRKQVGSSHLCQRHLGMVREVKKLRDCHDWHWCVTGSVRMLSEFEQLKHLELKVQSMIL